MSVVKIIEILSEGKSIEEAIKNGLDKAKETLNNIQEIYVQSVKAIVENGKITGFRVNSKLSFVIEH